MTTMAQQNEHARVTVMMRHLHTGDRVRGTERSSRCGMGGVVLDIGPRVLVRFDDGTKMRCLPSSLEEELEVIPRPRDREMEQYYAPPPWCKSPNMSGVYSDLAVIARRMGRMILTGEMSHGLDCRIADYDGPSGSARCQYGHLWTSGGHG